MNVSTEDLESFFRAALGREKQMIVDRLAKEAAVEFENKFKAELLAKTLHACSVVVTKGGKGETNITIVNTP